MPVVQVSLISSTLEVRVLCEGDRSDPIDKVGLGDHAYSPPFSRVVLNDAESQHLFIPLPLELAGSCTRSPLVPTQGMPLLPWAEEIHVLG